MKHVALKHLNMKKLLCPQPTYFGPVIVFTVNFHIPDRTDCIRVDGFCAKLWMLIYVYNDCVIWAITEDLKVKDCT